MSAPRKAEPEGLPDPRERPWILLGALALLLLPALLRGGLALDDRELIFENPATSGALGIWEILGRDYFHHLGDSGQWRPLASLSLRLDRVLFGDWIPGYHLMNGALQLGVVACAAALLRRLNFNRRASHLGLVFFALHPALADSVVWIAGRTSMLSALFPLAGAWLALRWVDQERHVRWPGLVVAALGLALGLLAKEDALIFALLLPCLGASLSRRAAWRLGLTAVGVLALYAVGRHFALGAAFPGASSPALGSRDLAGRLLVGGAAWVEALRLALVPFGYPPQYREAFLMERTAWIAGPWLVAVLGWSLALGSFVFVALRRRITLVSCATLLAVLSFVPVSQVVPIGEVFAPRFLYLPLLFAIPLTGSVLNALAPRRQAPLKLGVLALLLACALFARAGVYADQGTWRDEMLKYQPGDVPSWNARGLWYEEQGEQQRAIAAWQRAIELDPEYSRSWSNLGRVQMENGQLEDAQVSLRQALRAGPRNPIPRVNLASLLMREEQFEEAAQLYERATQLSPGLGPAWRGLGSARQRLGDVKGARRAFEMALELDPGDRSAQTLLRRIDADPASQADH